MPNPILDWRTREAIGEEVKTGVTDAQTVSACMKHYKSIKAGSHDVALGSCQAR